VVLFFRIFFFFFGAAWSEANLERGACVSLSECGDRLG